MFRLYALPVLFLIAFCPAYLFAKAPTSKITIRNGEHAVISITDPKLLRDFRVWAGPGTSSNEPRSLIVDWSRGPVSEPYRGLLLDRIDFYVKIPDERLMYVVWYEYDALRQQGYVYLPGRGEDWYLLDVSTIIHGVEGEWFHASREWDKIAGSLLTPSLSKRKICANSHGVTLFGSKLSKISRFVL